MRTTLPQLEGVLWQAHDPQLSETMLVRNIKRIRYAPCLQSQFEGQTSYEWLICSELLESVLLGTNPANQLCRAQRPH